MEFTKYYYIDNKGEQKGPLSFNELSTCGIDRKTLVWKKELTQWTKAEDIEELNILFGENPPPAPSKNNDNINIFLKPKNWMTQSLLVTILPLIFCCNIFSILGIIAIIKSQKVDKLFFMGRQKDAEIASRDVKKWINITIIIVSITIIIGIVITICGLLNEEGSDLFNELREKLQIREL